MFTVSNELDHRAMTGLWLVRGEDFWLIQVFFLTAAQPIFKACLDSPSERFCSRFHPRPDATWSRFSGQVSSDSLLFRPQRVRHPHPQRPEGEGGSWVRDPS